jgi:guanylate kinase
MNPTILTITGPSCSGKSTLEKMLCEMPGFKRATSTTTREPRAGEVDGREYFFIERNKFMDMLNAGEFIENVSFSGNSYGLTVAELSEADARGCILVVVCEPIGARQIMYISREEGWNHIGVFIDADPVTIYQRMLQRFEVEVRAANDQSMTALPELIGQFSKRLATRECVEIAWSKEARCGKDAQLYQRVFPRFDLNTKDDVIQAIRKLVLQSSSTVS